jgi:hypothetical protein
VRRLVLVVLAEACNLGAHAPHDCQAKIEPSGCHESPDGQFHEAGLPCNPLTQTGCFPGQKCTWIVYTASSGYVQCAPDGTMALGERCTRNPPGPSGYDDCMNGLFCVVPTSTGVQGTCAMICDHAGGWPDCTGPALCTAQAPIFGQPPVAGLCAR